MEAVHAGQAPQLCAATELLQAHSAGQLLAILAHQAASWHCLGGQRLNGGGSSALAVLHCVIQPAQRLVVVCKHNSRALPRK